jgi:CPA2 family monovalent cation:H+ antiporter-2
MRQQLRTVVLPPGAQAVGRTIRDVGLDHVNVLVMALRREGIVGRAPSADTRLREGDVLVLYGAPEDLERGESRLLMD